ncbi:peroxiredoxin family protein [Nitrospira sp. Kam-Ns4a]
MQERLQVSFPVLLDSERCVAQLYRARGIPVTMIVGRDGTLIGAVYGTQRWGSPKVMVQVQALLAGTAP